MYEFPAMVLTVMEPYLPSVSDVDWSRPLLNAAKPFNAPFLLKMYTYMFLSALSSAGVALVFIE